MVVFIIFFLFGNWILAMWLPLNVTYKTEKVFDNRLIGWFQAYNKKGQFQVFNVILEFENVLSGSKGISSTWRPHVGMSDDSSKSVVGIFTWSYLITKCDLNNFQI